MPFSACSKKALVPAHLQLQCDSLYLETSVCTEDSLISLQPGKPRGNLPALFHPGKRHQYVLLFTLPQQVSRANARADTGWFSPRGWGFPPRCFAGSRSLTLQASSDILAFTCTQQNVLRSPKRGSKFQARAPCRGARGRRLSSIRAAPPSTRGCVSLGEEAEQIKPTIALEQNSGGRRERHLPDKQRLHSTYPELMLTLYIIYL